MIEHTEKEEKEKEKKEKEEEIQKRSSERPLDMCGPDWGRDQSIDVSAFTAVTLRLFDDRF